MNSKLINNNLVKRIITGIFGGGILLFLIHIGLFYFLVLVIFLLVIMNLEYANLVKNIGYKYDKFFGIIFSIFISICFFLNGGIENQDFINMILPFIMTIFLLLLFSLKICFIKNKNLENDDFLIKIKNVFFNIIFTIFGMFYIGWFFSHVILIRENFIDDGEKLLFMLFFIIWVIDSTAYFVGIKFGKYKLSRLSPNKTIEGALAGFLISIIVIILFNSYIFMIDDLNILQSIILGILIGIFSQFGDIFESMLKRIANLKDSGNLLPGHGGILDRFDSIIFTAPVFYYFIKFVKF